MRFDPGKAWPHPVLRPLSCGDDYPYAEFEVEIEVERVRGNTALEVSAQFELSDPDLRRTVDKGAACYVLLIKASKTHFRGLLESSSPHISESFSAGDLSGLVEFAPFLVCTRELLGFRADGWHHDFSGRTFDIAAGSVLAEDEPKEYWVDTADEALLGSIFGLRLRSDLPDGCWDCELAEDLVWIVMSNADKARFEAARELANNTPQGQYLMNGLYLPALIKVLYEVDRSRIDYEDYRWFASLERRLEALECNRIGSENANRLSDAQKILEYPFPKMPIIALAEE